MSTSQYKVSWNEVASLSKVVATEITDNYVPVEVIVAIARGGLIPACLISNDLPGKIPVLSLGVSSYTSHRLQTKPIIYQNLNGSRKLIEGKHVLLVDDLVDSGSTMMYVTDYMKRYSPAAIDCAVLFRKRDTKMRECFYGEELDQKCWVVYPWEND